MADSDNGSHIEAMYSSEFGDLDVPEVPIEEYKYLRGLFDDNFSDDEEFEGCRCWSKLVYIEKLSPVCQHTSK